MNSLIQQVRTAQVRAGEDAVLPNLQSLGLVPKLKHEVAVVQTIEAASARHLNEMRAP
ncbi:hypothetical protein GmRootA79_08860 [Acidovorax sp. A79]|uniref:hypothetical protein n=1 Tax=Acidovorax sp. A79 TaxID=3056107 RepID=UPI0034E8F6CE